MDRYGTKQITKTNGTSPLLRYRPSVGPRAGGVLAKGIRGRVSVRPDQSSGRQSSFGDKEALFRKALDRYLKGPAAYTQEALREPTARAVVERLLLGAADLNTARRNPGGCLMVQGALACGEAADSIRQELTACRAAGEAAMRRRFERAKSEGDLPANVNPADLARYIATVLYGMAVQAAGGASRSKLQRVVEMALRTLPM